MPRRTRPSSATSGAPPLTVRPPWSGPGRVRTGWGRARTGGRPTAGLVIAVAQGLVALAFLSALLGAGPLSRSPLWSGGLLLATLVSFVLRILLRGPRGASRWGADGWLRAPLAEGSPQAKFEADIRAAMERSRAQDPITRASPYHGRFQARRDGR